MNNGATIRDGRMHKDWSKPVRARGTHPDGVLLEEGRLVHDAVLVAERAHEPNLLQDVVPFLQAHPSSASSASASSSVQHRSSLKSYDLLVRLLLLPISLWQIVKQ